jgi:hypothetical protein
MTLPRMLDWLWLATDAGLFVGALWVALRDMRRIRWAPALMRRTLATFGWYALAVTALMTIGLAGAGYTLAGAMLYAVPLSGVHLLVMAAILLLGLVVVLPRLERAARRDR